MTSRIEQIISEIEEYIDGCKFQPLSNSKIIVNKEELEELLTELRMKTPDEIKRYQKIISTRMLFWQMHRQKQKRFLLRHRFKPMNLSVNIRLCSRHTHRQTK